MNVREVKFGADPVRQGYSQDPVPHIAITELAEQLAQPDLSLVVFFCSPDFDLVQIAAEIGMKFDTELVIGCTTAGEITQDGYKDHSISGFSLAGSEFSVDTTLITDLANFEIEQGSEQVLASLRRLHPNTTTNSLIAKSTFGMLLIDGMSKQEELVVSTLNSAIDPIALFGGSAGDGLNFSSTKVFYNGEFHDNAAVFTLIRTSFAFDVFKFDHFDPTDKKMVVTEADPKPQAGDGDQCRKSSAGICQNTLACEKINLARKHLPHIR